MPKEFESFLQFNERLVQKAKIMEWLEVNFKKIKTDGSLCRAMLAIAIQRKGTVLDVAQFLGIDKTTASSYLKELVENGVLDTDRDKGKRRVYSPSFGNGRRGFS